MPAAACNMDGKSPQPNMASRQPVGGQEPMICPFCGFEAAEGEYAMLLVSLAIPTFSHSSPPIYSVSQLF
jgi:hypothetical protein